MASLSEQLRQSLEAKLEKLQKALKYWQTWEAEYEACKEEISELSDNATDEQMFEIGMDYEGDILNENEIKSIVNFGKAPTRTKTQVIALLSGRAETGRRNVEVVQRQLEKVEDELSEALSSNVTGESGGRMMEITEELDDHDNVISSNVSDFNQEMGQIRTVLENRTQTSYPEKVQELLKSQLSTESKNSSISASQSNSKLEHSTSGKTVNAGDTVTPSLAEVDADEFEGHALKSLVPGQSSYFDAYDSLNEINPIVATMDIEEISGSDNDMDSDEELSENEYGMNHINDEISEDYIREMEALIRKHAISNVGGGSQGEQMMTEKPFTPVKPSLRNTIPESQSSQLAERKKKGVKFAESLDIVPETQQSMRNEVASTEPEELGPRPMMDVVVERTTAAVSNLPIAAEKPRISRFKAAKSGISETSAPATRRSATKIPDEVSFKDELKLYNERMARPEQQLDRQLFQDENQPKVAEKVSKFKAARLGIRQDDI